ncbi:hypothetical protein L204_103441 [Cryptococcus depauperatus]|nr:hypothetical protein L204_01755 [Cryptococcus depauperatus CBS 7855]
MLLNELIKSGPLAKIWLSAHQERKLSKTQAMGVDVGESVVAILTQDTELPLRSSGPLMLGVVRIYSRKVGYLFDDCKEARERISLAFRPGIVDLPEEQVRAPHNAITISTRTEFDFNDWSWGPQDFLVASHSRKLTTTAKETTREFGAFNFGIPRAPSLYGGSVTTTSRQGSHDDSSLITSNAFSGIDLGLNLGDDTIEYGRDVLTPLSREGSAFEAIRASREKSLRAGSIHLSEGMDIGTELPPMASMDDYNLGGIGAFEPMDLGLDLDQGAERDRRASTELLTPPPATPPAESTQAVNSIQPNTTLKQARRPRLLLPDAETELNEEHRDRAATLREERYISAKAESGQMGEFMSNPGPYLFPGFKVDGEAWTVIGPQGIAPELSELFTFPDNILRKGRSLADTEETQSSKRPRLDIGERETEIQEEMDVDVELARRVDTANNTFDNDIFPAFQPDVGDFSRLADELPPMEAPTADDIPPMHFSREPSLALSRAESVARDVQFGISPVEFPLAIFDSRFNKIGERLSKWGLDTEDESRGDSTQGRHASMAVGLLRKELDAAPAEGKISFDKLAHKATKRAASTFFFELLSLSTRDRIRIKQQETFGDIEIQGKERLWPTSSQITSSRTASVA